MIDLAMVRLADEGVPIKALVRVFRRPFGEIEQVLREAKEQGGLVDLPAADWPAGTGRGSRIPTVAPERGPLPLWMVHGAQAEFRLTRSEALLVAWLVWRGSCSKAFLHDQITPEADPKIIDVFVCKARRKLAPFQIEIRTVWGWGHEFKADMRAAVRARLEATQPVDEPATDIAELVA